MRNEWILGGDPGRKGGIAVCDLGGTTYETWKWPGRGTPAEIEIAALELLREIAERYPGVEATVEQVHAMPGNGVTSMFNFGRAYCEMRMACHAAGVPVADVRPAAWQKAMGVEKRGTKSKTEHKNVLKGMAMSIVYAGTGVRKPLTHAVADAVLIAEFARRTLAGEA